MVLNALPALFSALLLLSGIFGHSAASVVPSKVEAARHDVRTPQYTNGTSPQSSTTNSRPAGTLVPMIPSSAANNKPTLQREVNLLYGSGQSYFAALNCKAEGDNQQVIAMHSFFGLSQSVDCTNGLKSLTFKDAQAALDAQKEFHWVNEHRDRSFVLISDWEGCGNGGRQPYEVTYVTFGTDKNGAHIADLTATPTRWANAMPNSSLHFSTAGLAASPARRGLGSDLVDLLDGDHNFGISLAYDFSNANAFSETVDGVTIDVGCNPCSTSGSLNFDLDIVKLSDGTGHLTVSLSSVGATATLAIDVAGQLNTAFNPSMLNLVNIPIDGIDIADIVKIGPQLNVNFGASISSWTASAKASMGVSATIPDGSSATIDFQNSTQNSLTGFVPQFSLIPPQLSASLSASADIFTEVTLSLDLTFHGFGISAGVDLKVPGFQLDINADASTNSGACKNGAVGADVSLQVGADLSGDVTFDSTSNDFPIFSKFFPLFDHCFAFGGSSNSTVPQRRSPHIFVS